MKSSAAFGPTQRASALDWRGKMMGGDPSAPFCRDLLTLSQFVMRYSVPADGNSWAMTEPPS